MSVLPATGIRANIVADLADNNAGLISAADTYKIIFQNGSRKFLAAKFPYWLLKNSKLPELNLWRKMELKLRKL